ncbi:FAD dependent oxidoreductase [Penicillium waksmanii]|uniref:FAD dependent oxidoreductase n=1 Tax=Penicillium waksmanii TaxID=69791 RepID=UPI002547D5B1|nr:FAD dependent oxidoreductase [Penicillium waksmanii]KAJ5979995.1 FAD dependent oxidoreductase [Penicillium waksmanii]
MTKKKIMVIGAGVAGLTTALLLSERSGYRITVAAKHMPGDYDIEYASPWAGANYMPVSIRGSKAAEWDKETWTWLLDLAMNRPESGVHLQECEIYSRAKDNGSATADWFSELLSPRPWFKDVVPNFRDITQDTLIPGVDSAKSFTSLGGVEDKSVVPARGQIVVVSNDAGKMVSISGTDDGDDEACYVMTRAAGGGTILGGSYQKGNWDSQVDPNLAVRIMKRAVKLCPALTGGKGIEHLDVIRHGVGLRPVREGGTRVEKERICDTWVVHNYGAGGAGYQSSFGCAQTAVDLIEEALGTGAKL